MLDRVRSIVASLSKLSDTDLKTYESVVQFREAVDLIADHVRQNHDITESSRIPLILTHYTSLHTLFSMLQASEPEENARLRLYDSVHLNDPLEGIATKEGQAIVSRFENHASSSSSYTRDIDREHIFSRFSNAYILSFIANWSSEDNIGDNLVFWRLYGDDGRGCSISFRPFFHWPDSARNALRHVRYHAGDVEDYASEILDLLELYNRLDRLVDTDIDLAYKSELVQTLPNLEECLAKRFLTKDNPYESENEVRLVRFARPANGDSPREPRVEIVRGTIRHFLEEDDLKLRGLATSHTILRVGPAVPHPEDAKRALRRLWAKSGLPSITVETSRINYRPSS